MYHSKVAQVLKLYSSAKTLWCVRDKADTQDQRCEMPQGASSQGLLQPFLSQALPRMWCLVTQDSADLVYVV